MRVHIPRRLRRWTRRRQDPGIAVSDPKFLKGLDTTDRAILVECVPYTMTSAERQVALLDAVQHVVDSGIPGSFAECGVWRGGSILAMIRKLQANGVQDRDIYLYDTFDGMTEPSVVDTSSFGDSALAVWNQAESEDRKPWYWFFNEEAFNLELVQEVLLGTGYPPDRLHFIEGKVEDTIPDQAPESLALLRLDTDWYESTRHELEHLYPLIAPGGVLLVDDYGHWDGCRRAVDEFFASPERRRPFLHRVDYTARIAVKPGENGST